MNNSEDLNSFQCKSNKIAPVIYGYIRRIKSTLNIRFIPSDIIDIIIRYYPPKYSILSIGRNLFGEFGLNEERENANKYIKLLKFSSLCYNHNEIYCGFFTFTVRTANNSFYGCGNNCDGQLGVNIKEYNIKQFNKIPTDMIINASPIKLFSDGPFSWHRIFVTENNKFYGFGRNKNSTLGSTEYPQKNYKPIELYNLTQLFSVTLSYEIISIQCGASHTLFLCKNGKLFSVGENNHGQCGHYGLKHIKQPKLIVNIPQIISISVGEYFTLCISINFKLYVFGNNKWYQLGIDKNKHEYIDDEYDSDEDDNNHIFKPTLNTYFNDNNILINKIKCGESHSLIIDTNGYGYCCGQNTHGESLGKWRNNYINNENNINNIIIKPTIRKKYNPICFQYVINDYNVIIEDGSCGKTHTMLLTKNTNQIYGFGANDHGQVAVNCKETKIHKPYWLKKSQIGIHNNNHIKRVIAGCDTTLIVCDKL